MPADMIDPVSNEPRNGWYQQRNHVRIPKSAESTRFLDAFYTKQGGNSSLNPPFPVAIFQNKTSWSFDPYDQNLVAPAGAVAGIGDRVGFTAQRGYGAMNNASFVQPPVGAVTERPKLVSAFDYKLLEFTGVEGLEASGLSLPVLVSGLPRSIYFFALLKVDSMATGQVPMATVRKVNSNNFMEATYGNLDNPPTIRVSYRLNNTTTRNTTTIGNVSIPADLHFVEMLIQINSIASAGCRAFIAVDGETKLDGTLNVTAGSDTNTGHQSVCLGFTQRSGPQIGMFIGKLGRCGFIRDYFPSSEERAALMAWARGKAFNG